MDRFSDKEKASNNNEKSILDDVKQIAIEAASKEASKIVYQQVSALGHQFTRSLTFIGIWGSFLALLNSLIATILIGAANARPLTFFEITTIIGSSFAFTLILGLIAYVRVLKANSNFIKDLKR